MSTGSIKRYLLAVEVFRRCLEYSIMIRPTNNRLYYVFSYFDIFDINIMAFNFNFV